MAIDFEKNNKEFETLYSQFIKLLDENPKEGLYYASTNKLIDEFHNLIINLIAKKLPSIKQLLACKYDLEFYKYRDSEIKNSNSLYKIFLGEILSASEEIEKVIVEIRKRIKEESGTKAEEIRKTSNNITKFLFDILQKDSDSSIKYNFLTYYTSKPGFYNNLRMMEYDSGSDFIEKLKILLIRHTLQPKYTYRNFCNRYYQYYFESFENREKNNIEINTSYTSDFNSFNNLTTEFTKEKLPNNFIKFYLGSGNHIDYHIDSDIPFSTILYCKLRNKIDQIIKTCISEMKKIEISPILYTYNLDLTSEDIEKIKTINKKYLEEIKIALTKLRSKLNGLYRDEFFSNDSLPLDQYDVEKLKEE